MSKIVLTRVDSRLIHGQVVTKWLQQSGANEILVVSDELEQDEFLQSIYLMAAPPGVSVVIKGIE
ncbi:PTS sugar transporter subunit IIB, partial [Enterococcus faecalis]